MQPLRRVLETFGGTAAGVRETFTDAVLEAAVSALLVPSADVLTAALEALFGDDSFQLSVTIGHGEPESLLATRPQDVESFLQRLNGQLQVPGVSPASRLKLAVEKRPSSGRVAVYAPEQFFACIGALPLRDVLERFDALLRPSGACEFACFEPVVAFYTKTLTFREVSRSPSIVSGLSIREDVLNKQGEVCHFADAGNYRLIPDDFRLLGRSANESVNAQFDRVCLLLSLCFLADITRLKGEDTISYKLKGYKTFEGDTDGRGATGKALAEYYRIYQWIYAGGPATDKAGLARNLVSLHVLGDEIVALRSGAYDSVQSGYDIYLKQNVKQYLEVKNKLVDYLSDTGRDMIAAVQGLGDSLRTNFLAFSSFFVTVLIVRIATSKEFAGAFPPPLAAIAFTLLGGSLLYLIGNVLLLRKEQQRLEESYHNLPTRYADLLSAGDLSGILAANAQELAQTKKYLEFKRGLYVTGWITHLLLFSALVIFLMSQANPSSGGAATPTPKPSVARPNATPMTKTPSTPTTAKP